MTAVVIPAHDEAARIGRVLLAAAGAPSVSQIVVVADACTDGTADAARQSGVLVLETTAADKGTAMATGLAAVSDPLVLFLDADLEGLLPAHVEALASIPPITGMVVGLRQGSPPTGLPPISGERRLPSDFARSVRLAGTGYRAELLLDAAVGRAGLPHRHYEMKGVTNPSRPLRHPLMWADLATTAVLNAPSLAAYTVGSFR